MDVIKENLIKMAKVNRGLCTTCNNAPTCLFYQGNGSRLVWYCETFDNYVQVKKSTPKIETRIEAKIELPEIMNSGDAARMVKIPYKSILFFTDESS